MGFIQTLRCDHIASFANSLIGWGSSLLDSNPPPFSVFWEFVWPLYIFPLFTAQGYGCAMGNMTTLSGITVACFRLSFGKTLRGLRGFIQTCLQVWIHYCVDSTSDWQRDLKAKVKVENQNHRKNAAMQLASIHCRYIHCNNECETHVHGYIGRGLYTCRPT